MMAHDVRRDIVARLGEGPADYAALVASLGRPADEVRRHLRKLHAERVIRSTRGLYVLVPNAPSKATSPMPTKAKSPPVPARPRPLLLRARDAASGLSPGATVDVDWGMRTLGVDRDRARHVMRKLVNEGTLDNVGWGAFHVPEHAVDPSDLRLTDRIRLVLRNGPLRIAEIARMLGMEGDLKVNYALNGMLTNGTVSRSEDGVYAHPDREFRPKGARTVASTVTGATVALAQSRG